MEGVVVDPRVLVEPKVFDQIPIGVQIDAGHRGAA